MRQRRHPRSEDHLSLRESNFMSTWAKFNTVGQQPAGDIILSTI